MVNPFGCHETEHHLSIWLIVMVNVVLQIPIPWMVREMLMSTASKKKSIKDLGETNIGKMEEHLLHPPSLQLRGTNP